MRPAPIAVSAFVLAAVLGAPSSARANGRYPASNQLVFADSDPDFVLLRMTFGPLISHDRGKTFEWVCEQAMGYSGIEDPMYALTPSGTLIATTAEGLAVSTDKACNWSFAAGALDSHMFVDLTSNPNDRKDVLVMSVELESDAGHPIQDDAGNYLFATNLWETTNEGTSFQKLGTSLDPLIIGKTLDVTKSDPKRIYVTGIRKTGTPPEGLLLVSSDHGQSWTEEPVPLVGGEVAVFIAAVDPTNADRVYLRTATPDLQSGVSTQPQTRLILREIGADGGFDAGPTQRTLFTADHGLAGAALSADGGTIYIGSSDGLWSASTTDFAFRPKAKFGVQCLAVSPDGLWACAGEKDGFILGLSTDEGATFLPKLHFCDVKGPLSTCPASAMTPSSTPVDCQQFWPPLSASLGCTDDRAEDAGNGAGDGSTVTVGDAGATSSNHATTSSDGKGGCSCEAAPAGPWGALVSAAAATLAALRRRRRRDRSRRSEF